MKKIGIILGSGLSKFANELENSEIIYSEIGGIHKKEVIEGKYNNKPVIIFSGRNHFYETYSKEKVFRNVNLAKDHNVDLLIITNAAGGLNPFFKVSDLMLIKSYFNFFQKRLVTNNIYNFDTDLIKWATNLALQNKIKLHSGNYYASTGPTYETNSEIKYIKKTKADSVGMSTIPDILRAKELGIKTLGISCITNMLFSDMHIKVTHDEVVEAGNVAFQRFSKLLKVLINDY